MSFQIVRTDTGERIIGFNIYDNLDNANRAVDKLSKMFPHRKYQLELVR